MTLPIGPDLPDARPNGRRLLTSLAVLNVNWDNGSRSYLDNFVPFALEAMRRNQRADYSAAEVATMMTDEFGLDIPVHVVDSILSRPVRSGLLVRDRRRIRAVPESLGKWPSGIQRKQSEAGRDHDLLVARLVEFARVRFGIEWTADLAEDALLNHVERHAIPLLASAVEGRRYDPQAAEKVGNDFVVRMFVVDLVDNSDAGFAHVEALVKGCMLSAALYVGSPAEVTSGVRFRRTTLYLDTPICLKALGYEGEEPQASTLQTLQIAEKQGARLACFEHTFHEIEGVLAAAGNQLRTAAGTEVGTRGVADFFVRSGVRPADVDGYVATLDRDLTRLRVEIDETPPHDPRIAIDERALDDLLQERIGYFRDRAREHDVDSLTAVHRLRGGSSTGRLESCKAVLITDNYNLVGAARTFFRAESHDWPVAMPEHELAALVWVKAPMAAPDLPRKQIMADCYAALAPSQAHWERVVAEVAQLEGRGEITHEDVTLLINAREAKRSLMNLTLGDPRRVTSGAIRTALEETRREIAKPAHAERDSARERAAAAADREAEADFERLRAEADRDEIQAERDQLVAQEQSRRQFIGDRASRHARWILRVVALVLVAPGVVAVVAGQVFPSWQTYIPGFVAIPMLLMSAVVVVASLNVFGGSITEWLTRPERRLARRLERRALKAAGFSDAD